MFVIFHYFFNDVKVRKYKDKIFDKKNYRKKIYGNINYWKYEMQIRDFLAKKKITVTFCTFLTLIPIKSFINSTIFL
jgi:hypothetical protein